MPEKNDTKNHTKNQIKTRITELFGVKHPVVQTGMGWVAYPPLVIASAKAGGLGILASATMDYEEMAKSIREVEEAAGGAPFGVNLRTDTPDIQKRVDFLISAAVKVASFAQAPNQKIIEKLKSAGVVVMPTIGARRHAEKMAEWGVDAVIAQGAEGGGHTGSIPTSVLIPQVVEAVDIPVIGAGGFTDGKGLAAALAFGAEGIAMGTRFLLSAESPVSDTIKNEYFKTKADGTVVTKAIDGFPQRVIQTKVVKSLEKSGFMAFPRALKNALKFKSATSTSLTNLLKEGLAMKKNQNMTWSQLVMAANAPLLTKASMVDGRLDVGILPTGVGLGVIEKAETCHDIIGETVDEAHQILKDMSSILD